MDFEKIGRAALDAGEDYADYVCDNDLPFVDREEHKAAGRAAVAAMIPATEGGLCSTQCPFRDNESPGSRCNLLGHIETEDFTHDIQPGPSCPAHGKAVRK